MTTPLGLIMLKTTSEELACPREDLSIARKEELRKLLLDQVQTVLGLLTGRFKCFSGESRRGEGGPHGFTAVAYFNEPEARQVGISPKVISTTFHLGSNKILKVFVGFWGGGGAG